MAKAPTTTEAAPNTIEGRFPETPEGWAGYWATEFKAAREEGSQDWKGITAFHEKAGKAVRRFRAENSKTTTRSSLIARINIFPANIQTQKAILVGQSPKSEVTRRYADADDDVARIAATMLQRVLDYGIEEEKRGLTAVISQCTVDRLLPGMCGSRVQFSCDFEKIPETPAKMGPCPGCGGSGYAAEPTPALDLMGQPEPALGEPTPCSRCGGVGQVETAPAVPEQEKPCNEEVEPTYIHWRDQIWSAARVFDEVRWWAFSADMGKKQLVDAFGPEVAQKIPLSVGKGGKGRDSGDSSRRETPWARARVWEIWSKEHRRQFFYVEGCKECFWHVDNPQGDDPLGLEGFWPFPAPMMANATNDAYLPLPDYEYAKDLYDEADELTSRIRGIVRAIKVAGAYDKANKALSRLLDEACELELIPVANWAEFMKNGGMGAAFQLLPIAEMVQTVQALVAQRNIVIEGIYQVTGLGDIIRGQQTQSETATTSAIKARFASVRLQDLQKEVARYATDLQRIRKEVIAKHYSIETIIERSSIMQTEEAKTPEGKQRIVQAAQLIKDRHLDFRVSIKPEQISLQDWAQLKQERGAIIQALAGYFQSMVPFVQMVAPGGPQATQAAMKFVLQTAQWMVAGMPGSGGVESAFDSFVKQVEVIAKQAAMAPPQPPPPDPKLEVANVKAQAEGTKAQLGVQTAVLDAKAHAMKTGLDIQKSQIEHAQTMQSEEAKQRTEALAAVNHTITPGAPV